MKDSNAELIASFREAFDHYPEYWLPSPNGTALDYAKRLADALESATPRIVPSDNLLIRALNSSNENVTYNVLADMALARGIRYDPQTGRWQPFTPTESGEQTA